MTNSRMLDSAAQDVRYALRGIRRSPGFALAIVLTLGLAIGANAALFSVVDVLLFRPPAGVADPGRVQRLVLESPRQDDHFFTVTLSYPDYRDLRDRTPAFSSLAAFGRASFSYGRGVHAENLKGAIVSTNYFSTLGVRPAVGSFFPPVDDRDLVQVAVLGFDAWKRLFGGDPRVIGRTIVLRDRSYRVLGVAPPGFRGIDLDAIDVFLPVGEAPLIGFNSNVMQRRNTHFLQAVGRLRSGMTPAIAAARATAALNAIMAENPDAGLRAGHKLGARVSLAPINDHYPSGTPGSSPVPAWLLGVTAAPG